MYGKSAPIVNRIGATLVAFIFLFSLLLSLPSSALAAFKQEQYYDWGVSDRRAPTVLGLTARAQEPTATAPATDTTTTTPTLSTDLTSAGVLPDSPLHFFETTFEAVQETFTFDAEAKAELKLDHAEERLSEANTLIDTGKVDEGTDHLATYQAKLADATDDLLALQEQGVDVTGLADLVEQATARHTTVLEAVAVQVPETATAAIQNAINVSQTGMDRAADARGEPPVPVDLLARMNALRGQGILSEDEAGSLVNAPSREEARKIFKSLMDQGVLPEADYKRFDTAQAKYLPQDFVKGVELRKFSELQRLEALGEPPREIRDAMEDFARTFTPGAIVPPEIRKYWAQTVRLEEVQKTIRPDLLSADLFTGNQEAFNKLQGLQDRVRPTSQEGRIAEEFLRNNPGKTPPPEIQRILDLKDRFGTLAEGVAPPPGHQQSTFIPSSVFRYIGEIPFQLGAPGLLGPPDQVGQTGIPGTSGTYSGTSGTYQQGAPTDYSQYFQQGSFLPQPTYTTGGTGTTTYHPPTGTTGTTSTGTSTGDFRYPYYPPHDSTTGTTSTSGTYYQQPTGTTSTSTYQQPTSGTTSTYQAPSTSTSTYTAPTTSDSGTTTTTSPTTTTSTSTDSAPHSETTTSTTSTSTTSPTTTTESGTMPH